MLGALLTAPSARAHSPNSRTLIFRNPSKIKHCTTRAACVMFPCTAANGCIPAPCALRQQKMMSISSNIQCVTRCTSATEGFSGGTSHGLGNTMDSVSVPVFLSKIDTLHTAPLIPVARWALYYCTSCLLTDILINATRQGPQPRECALWVGMVQTGCTRRGRKLRPL